MWAYYRKLARYFSLISLTLVFTQAHAELNDICGCNAGLAREVVQYSSNSQLKLAFIQQIDEKQYDKIIKEGSVGVDVIDLISGTANYKQFDEKRRAYLSNTNFTFSVEQSQSLLFSTINTTDWGKCKRACIESQNGFFCDVADFTKKNIVASCNWKTVGVEKSRKVKVIADGESLKNETIDPNTSRDWHFARNPSQDILMTFTLENGPSRTLKVVATPIAPQPPKLDKVPNLSKWYFLRSVSTNWTLNVYGARTNISQPLCLAAADPSHQWKFKAVANNAYEIVSSISGNIVGRLSRKDLVNDNIVQGQPDDALQTWELVPTQDNKFLLRATGSNLYIAKGEKGTNPAAHWALKQATRAEAEEWILNEQGDVKP
jgi:hypothetical protein